MLLLGSRLLNTPVMSLQTGTQLASTVQPVIDPANLRIVAYEIDGPLLSEKPSFLRTADVREYGRLGMIIDSNDEIVGLDDVLHLKKVQQLGFRLIGLAVIDDQKRKLGKIEDYTLETGDFIIQQLTVKRGFFKGIADTGLLIHRSQILEINNKSIVVKSPTKKVAQPVMQALRGDYVNPFRSAQPETEASTASSD